MPPVVVSGEESHRLIEVPMGQRNTGIGKASYTGRDSRCDPERYARFQQRDGLLATATEHERIAALQSQYALALSRELNEPDGYVLLRGRRPSTPLSRKLRYDVRPAPAEDFPVGQRIVDNMIGLLQGIQSVQRQKARVTWAGADKPDQTAREFGPLLRQRKQTSSCHTANNPDTCRMRVEPQSRSSFKSLESCHRIPEDIEYDMQMNGNSAIRLRTGYTTGACATAASVAACTALLSGDRPRSVTIKLPRGQLAEFRIERYVPGDGKITAGVRKDAGDDPDVTHGAIVEAKLSLQSEPGVRFRAGSGVGTVTKPGLPVSVGEPAINPVPRKMIREALLQTAAGIGVSQGFRVELSIPNGEHIALKTWNPRLGIKGGLSILGTTGIVRPYSCSAWIASIHRGIDVARATGEVHVVGATGATSEAVAKALYGLPDHALLDMGDFAGGMLKYLRRNPLPFLTISGGFAKLSKLAQGAYDLHSKRSQVDFRRLATIASETGCPPQIVQAVRETNTAMQVLELAGKPVARRVAIDARRQVRALLRSAPIEVEVMVVDRHGRIVARSSSNQFHPARGHDG